MTLFLQGAGKDEISVLLKAFSKQDTPQRWNNYRLGCSLYASLLQWGMDIDTSLDIVSAAARSSIPAEHYRGIIDILTSSMGLRVSPETMSGRIIRTLPGVSSIEQLKDIVLY